MVGLEILLAAVLLTSPDSACIAEDDPDIPLLRLALTRLAVAWEILDPADIHHFLGQDHEFARDLHILQTLYRDLRHAPLLGECERFPHRELAEQYLIVNRSYREDLKARIELERANQENLQALHEAEFLFRVWDAVRNSRCAYYTVPARRQYLRELRDLVGPEAFYSGRLPPPVPVWRLPQSP